MFAVLEPEKIEAWAKAKEGITKKAFNIATFDMKDEALLELIKADVYRLATEKKFNSLEKPKKFHFSMEAWTVDNDLLTPTFKLKRNVAKVRFASEIEEMYRT